MSRARFVRPSKNVGRRPEDPEVAVELHPDHVDDLDEVVQALHRVVLRLDRDDHAVRRDEPVDREEPEVRRAVDEDVVVDGDLVLERVAQDLLATERREELALGAGEVDVRGRDVDAGALGRADTSVKGRATVGEDIGHRLSTVLRLMPRPGRQVRLRIHVDAEDAIALFLEGPGEIDRRGRLADAALLVCDRDHLRHRGITSNLERRRDGRRGRGKWPCYRSDSVGERRGYPQIMRVVHHFCGYVARGD